MLCLSGFELYSRWMPLVTTDDRKQFQGINVVLNNNKTEPLILEFSHMKTRLSFFKIQYIKYRDVALHFTGFEFPVVSFSSKMHSF